MIGLGLLLLFGGIGLFLLGALAEMNHPTGGNGTTEEFMRDGGMVAAAGLVFLFLGWLL
ncbi:MAG: hypothetical protein WCY29_13640 [Novosphingobium sp.]